MKCRFGFGGEIELGFSFALNIAFAGQAVSVGVLPSTNTFGFPQSQISLPHAIIQAVLTFGASRNTLTERKSLFEIKEADRSVRRGQVISTRTVTPASTNLACPPKVGRQR